jgi:hypothetical protein
MIPNNKHLKKFSLNLKDEDYFSVCFEYCELSQLFETHDLLEKLSLFMDMVLSPIYILYKIFTMDFSLLDILSIMKCKDLWIDFIRYEELKLKLFEWKFIVRFAGGPWISSSDPLYNPLVYADGMTRISRSNKF